MNFLVFFCIAFISSLQGSVTIHNQTDKKLFYAPYFKDKITNTMYIASKGVYLVHPQKSFTFKKPKSRKLTARFGVVSFHVKMLKKQLTHREYKNLENFSIEETAPTEFFITEVNSMPYCENDYKEIHDDLKSVLLNLISSPKDKKTDSTNKTSNITVRQSNDLSPQEQKFIEKRTPKVKKALEKILGPLDGDIVPKITVMGSGGGYRALIGYCGALEGLYDIGVWDACMYASGVSGSTWLLSALYSSDESMKTFAGYIQPRLEKNLLKQNIYKSKELLSLFKRKYDFTMVDVWGLLISKALLTHDNTLGSNVTLSKLAPKINSGSMPLYICTAVHRGMEKPKWFEYTPYEVGSQDYGCYIPAAYAGARFSEGKCVEPDFKEYPLGLHCGVFGSAFAVDAQRAASEVNSVFLDLLLKQTLLRGLQASTGSLTNFMQGIETTGMGKSKRLKLVDSAYDINIPTPPCLRRNPDIVIIVNVPDQAKKDSSSVLKKALEDARNRGYSVPEYKPEGIHDRAVTILKPEKNKSGPTIIYIPNIYQGYSTLKLQYSKAEFDALYKPMKKALHDNKEEIYKAIKEVWNTKNKNHSILPPSK